MYHFLYDDMKPTYGDKCKLLFTDTDNDSFCYHIQTDDLYNEMSEYLDLFYNNNFEKDDPLYTTKKSPRPWKS